ncbi:MAG: thioredoxin family protein, partial [Fibrobacteria bacterium]|nr:thioredoxin family protein [Fibrobacteria bacterium]
IDSYPDDNAQKIAEVAQSIGYTFPFLLDETQKTAHAYHAACTPDIYLFNKNLELVYRGQFDNSRPGNDIPVTGSDLSAAIEQVLRGQTPSEDQRPATGCNIKWKQGNEPPYFG